jgi:16S rRNA (guanine966-N2)-methyltransferase
MRIIAGTLKGRRLKAPAWEGLRPTSDKLRETLFNILAPRIVGARLLDLYAGTGAIGLEALSRGAAHVTFIERDPRAIALIEGNLKACAVSDGYAIIRSSVARGLERLRGRETFDIVVLDPPYAHAAGGEFPGVLALAADLASAGGILVVEHARKRPVPAVAVSWGRSRQVASGDSMLSFYVARTDESGA